MKSEDTLIKLEVEIKFMQLVNPHMVDYADGKPTYGGFCS